MENTFEKLKEIKKIMLEEQIEMERQIVRDFQKVVNKLLKRDREQLNMAISNCNYAFKNGILHSSNGCYETSDEEQFIANGISHKVGFKKSCDTFDSICILGGGCCGNIGVVYKDDFYITDDCGRIEENGKWKNTTLILNNCVAEYIYNTMGIEKVKLAKKWVEYFDNGLDKLLKNFEEKINQIYNNKKNI